MVGGRCLWVADDLFGVRAFGAFLDMDSLTIFGLFSVTAMLVFYALEHKNHWFILAFAFACVLGSIYGFLQGAWPFGLVEAVWSTIAVRRWWITAGIGKK